MDDTTRNRKKEKKYEKNYARAKQHKNLYMDKPLFILLEQRFAVYFVHFSFRCRQ